jgi:hypothetical protein
MNDQQFSFRGPGVIQETAFEAPDSRPRKIHKAEGKLSGSHLAPVFWWLGCMVFFSGCAHTSVSNMPATPRVPASAVVPAQVTVSLESGGLTQAVGSLGPHTYQVAFGEAIQESLKAYGSTYFRKPTPAPDTVLKPPSYEMSVLCKSADLVAMQSDWLLGKKAQTSAHLNLLSKVTSDNGQVLATLAEKGERIEHAWAVDTLPSIVASALEQALTGLFAQAAERIRADLDARNKAPMTQQTATKPKPAASETAAETQARIEAGKKEWERLRPKVEEALARKDLKQAVVLLNQALAVGQPSEEAQRQLSAIGRSAEWVKVRPKITVQKFDVAEGLAPSLGAFLYNALMSDLANSQQFTVVDWQEMDRVLSLIAKAQPNVSVEDQKKLAMNQLGISQMVLGSVYKVGEKYYLTVKTLGLDLGVLALHKKSVASEDEFEACITALARQMLQDASY